jgi:hypothetical protein
VRPQFILLSIRSSAADTDNHFPGTVKVVRKYELNASQVSFLRCGLHCEVLVSPCSLALICSKLVLHRPSAK